MSTQFNIKTNGTWKTPTGYHIKHAGIWKPIKNAYVKVAGAWKQYYPIPTDIVMNIYPDRIVCKYGSTESVYTNKDLNLLKLSNVGEQPFLHNAWFNLNIGNVLDTLKLNLPVSKLTIISNGVRFGGKHGKIISTQNGTGWALDTTTRKEYALHIGQNILAENVEFVYSGEGNVISGFGGNSIERHDGVFYNFISNVDPTSPPSQPKHIIGSDVFGITVYSYYDQQTLSGKAAVYNKPVNASWAGPTVSVDISLLMRYASAYIDFSVIDVFLLNNNRYTPLERYKEYIKAMMSPDVLGRFLAFQYKQPITATTPLIVLPRADLSTTNGVWSGDFSENPYDGGHGLKIGRNITISPKTTTSKLIITGGLPGGFTGQKINQIQNSCEGCFGGLGIPDGIGSFGFNGYKTSPSSTSVFYSNNQYYYTRPKLTIGVDWFNDIGVYDAYVNFSGTSLYSGNNGYALKPTYRTTPGLEYKYWHCYSTQNQSGAYLPDFKKSIGDTGTVTNIPIIGRLNTYSHNKRMSWSTNHITTPGLAINRNGYNITFNGVENTNFKIVGYELYRGDGTDASHWVP